MLSFPFLNEKICDDTFFHFLQKQLKVFFCFQNMVVKDSKISTKNDKKYCCQCCDFNTSKKTDFVKHLATDKHKKRQNGSEMVVNDSKISTKNEKIHKCLCGKVYKYDSGYYRHKKKCSGTETINEIGLTDKELLHILIQQNQKLMNIVENGTNNTTNNNTNTNTNNSHNTTNNVDAKTFNLNFFLNETCKDAMNISEFVSSIKVNLQDLENTGKKGYIQGISNIILKNLNELEQSFRPIHCSDSKREVFYIKENDEWQKEHDEKPILTKAIKVIANENIKQIKHWRDKYPDCTDSDSKKNNTYLKIVSNSMNGLTEQEGNKNIDKIISNIAKEVTIDKTLSL